MRINIVDAIAAASILIGSSSALFAQSTSPEPGFILIAEAGYPEGECGGTMKGYDGRGYTCESNRKPVCEQSSGRCVCLARTECGAKKSEPW